MATDLTSATNAIAQYNENIQNDRQTISDYTEAIAQYQEQINVAEATIETDQLNLANDNLDPEAVPEIEANIAEAQASIDENQQLIIDATTVISATQDDLAQQEAGLAAVEGQLTGSASAASVSAGSNPQVPGVPGSVSTSRINTTPGTVYGQPQSVTTNQIIRGAAQLAGVPTNVINSVTASLNSTIGVIRNTLSTAPTNSIDQAAADQQAATLDLARQQQNLSMQRNQANNGDWRVKLSLAKGSTYLYNATNPGILQPLANTGGVVFPYTPSIDTSYRAQYSNYDLTHSNYRGYFYQNSFVDLVSVRALFTAQCTADANYLLAVIHFFKSVTKMFYGQDAERGSPPPLVYLTGLGQYQFSEHACLVTNFTYNLPADVDYIRANTSADLGLNKNNQRNRYSVDTTTTFDSTNRLGAAGLPVGGQPTPPQLASTPLSGPPTYVPTKMEIALTLLPVQSRQQVSQQFSLKRFASGQLLTGGFW